MGLTNHLVLYLHTTRQTTPDHDSLLARLRPHLPLDHSLRAADVADVDPTPLGPTGITNSKISHNSNPIGQGFASRDQRRNSEKTNGES